MQELVIFDLDNTLINSQIQKILIRALLKKKIVTPVLYLKIIFWFSLYQLGFIKNPQKIMKRGFSYLKNKEVAELEKIVDDFLRENLDSYIYKETPEIIKEHKLKNRLILIVSNVVEPVLGEIAKRLEADYFLGTKLEVRNGKFTGKINGDIMYGENKVKAVENFVRENQLSLNNSWAYSDHHSDIYFLKRATYPVAVNPTRFLKKTAKLNNWPILIFK